MKAGKRSRSDNAKSRAARRDHGQETQATPHESRQMKRLALACMNFSLRRAARTIALLYDRELAGAGIRSTQFSVLLTVAAYGPQKVTKLAKGLAMDRTTLSKNILPLVRRGFLESRRLPDKRQR